MTKVSILVAVYNGEKYIEKCLRSLVAQTYKNIEIVCVDDGSQDASSSIIESFMAEYPHIKLVKHETNKGVAHARNTGIGACTGDIIGYLDCDDIYADDTVEKLVAVFDAHEDADCVLYRCVLVDKDGKTTDYNGLSFEALDGKQAFVESLTWNIHGVYAARAELFRQYNNDTSCRHFSDDNTTRLHYLISRKVYQSDAPYFYWSNPNSITNQISVLRMDYLTATQRMKSQLTELKCSEAILQTYEVERLKVLVDCYMFYYKNRRSLSSEDKAYCLSELKTGWESIDTSLIKTNIKKKLGYIPFKGCWSLFRFEEELYFFLKRISGRL